MHTSFLCARGSWEFLLSRTCMSLEVSSSNDAAGEVLCHWVLLLLVRERFPDRNLKGLRCMNVLFQQPRSFGLGLHITTAWSLESLADGSMLPDHVAA